MVKKNSLCSTTAGPHQSDLYKSTGHKPKIHHAALFMSFGVMHCLKLLLGNIYEKATYSKSQGMQFAFLLFLVHIMAIIVGKDTQLRASRNSQHYKGCFPKTVVTMTHLNLCSSSKFWGWFFHHQGAFAAFEM